MEYTKISKKIKSPVDGLKLDLLVLVPDGTPKGILQIHHGMAEYKERYLPFMEYFAQAGYVTAIHDCRGHGKSVRTKKDLGYMYGGGMDALIEDTAEITRMLKEEWQGVPLILLGHSMGSMVVRCFTKKYDDLLDMLESVVLRRRIREQKSDWRWQLPRKRSAGHIMSAVFWNCFPWEAIRRSSPVREVVLPGAVPMNRSCVIMKPRNFADLPLLWMRTRHCFS